MHTASPLSFFSLVFLSKEPSTDSIPPPRSVPRNVLKKDLSSCIAEHHHIRRSICRGRGLRLLLEPISICIHLSPRRHDDTAACKSVFFRTSAACSRGAIKVKRCRNCNRRESAAPGSSFIDCGVPYASADAERMPRDVTTLSWN